MFLRALMLFSLSCVFYLILRENVANALPTALQLGGAIVAAVEQDAEQDDERKNQETEQQEAGAKMLQTQQWNEMAQLLLTALMGGDELATRDLEYLLKDLDEGRGKFRKQRKMLKYLYPLLVGVLIAKSFVLPLVLTALTALSSTSFVMSKIALLVSGMLALKWLFAGQAGGGGGGGGHDTAQQRTKFEIVHLPPRKPYHRGGIGAVGVDGAHLAGDLNWSDTNLVGSQKYIPLAGGSFDDASNRYPDHNFNSAAYADKPFL